MQAGRAGTALSLLSADLLTAARPGKSHGNPAGA
jgi:hypothetical protein